jgi:hypothetical protein
MFVILFVKSNVQSIFESQQEVTTLVPNNKERTVTKDDLYML